MKMNAKARRLLILIFISVFVSSIGAGTSQAKDQLVFDPASNSWKRKSGPSVLPKFTRSDASPIPRRIVQYDGDLRPRTIIIDTAERRLYRVQEGKTAIQFAIGVGREGFDWKGQERVSRKAEWPTWTPPAEMRAREAANGRDLPISMEGGPDNPLGARAIYLGQTLYRIHGTNQPWTIGQAVSSGCIRMANDDVEFLYELVRVGDQVIVR